MISDFKPDPLHEGDLSCDIDDPDIADSEDENASGLYEHFRFVADKGQTLLRVDKFLVERMPKASSRNRIQ